MAVRMLFPPQLQEQGRHLAENRFRPMDAGMTAQAKRDHQVEYGASRNPMMNCDRPLASTRCSTHPASITVALQHLLAQPIEQLFILAPKRVANCADAKR